MKELSINDLEILIVLVQNAHEEEKDNVDVDNAYLNQLESLYDKLKTTLIAVNRR